MSIEKDADIDLKTSEISSSKPLPTLNESRDSSIGNTDNFLANGKNSFRPDSP